MRVKVLIAGAPGETVTALESVCAELGYEAFICEDMADALAFVAEKTVDIACLAHYLQDGTAFELCRDIRKQASWRATPVVLVTERANSSLIEKAFASGFNETFHLQEKQELEAFISRYGAYRRPIAGQVLLVEDSLSQRQMVSSMLEDIGLQVVACDQVENALQAYQQHAIDLIITDVVLEGELTGLDLITRIRRMEGSHGDIPIIVMSSYRTAAQRLEPFRIGADDYVSKPLEGDELIVRARRLIESRQLLQQVREQQKRLEDTNRFMTRMLSRVSHECRNSINIVLGVSKLMLRKDQLSPQQTTKVETMANASRHQLSLLNDMLDYTKLESGNIEAQPEQTDIRELVSEAVSMFRYACEDAGLGLETKVKEDVPHKAGVDGRLVKQVIINLLSNAVKFTRQGGVSVQIAVADSQLEVAVQDTGPGIAKAELELLFEEFRQTSSGISSGTGTGLGLSLCLGFARVMGGTMTVESSEGQGSRFALHLPI